MTVTVLRLCCFESTTATAPVDLIGEKIDAALRKALGGISQPSNAALSVMQQGNGIPLHTTSQDIARIIGQHVYRSHEPLPTSVLAVSSQPLLDLLSHFGTVTASTATAPAPIPPTLSQILAALNRH